MKDGGVEVVDGEHVLHGLAPEFIGDAVAHAGADARVDEQIRPVAVRRRQRAQERDVPFSNYASLTRAPEVQALIQGEVDRVNRNFARVEQIKKFFLLDTQLSAEDEELTPTMKLKRKLIQTKYAERIELMYRG